MQFVIQLYLLPHLVQNRFLNSIIFYLLYLIFLFIDILTYRNLLDLIDLYLAIKGVRQVSLIIVNLIHPQYRIQVLVILLHGI